MIAPGDVISYMEMCGQEGASLQRGMNFRLRGQTSVILMSVRRGAPYSDRIEEDGRILIYEGHDAPRTESCPDPKSVNQPDRTPGGALTQNGLFWEAVTAFKSRRSPAELVRVYEKIKTGIWAYAGVFELIDARKEKRRGRQVFKFRLQQSSQEAIASQPRHSALEHARLIPTAVKIEVWKRDKGKCVLCGSEKNLHFDHDLPFSKGGTSLLAKNVQLLCAKHNLQKHDKIQ
jgi:hypothetical protein